MFIPRQQRQIELNCHSGNPNIIRRNPFSLAFQITKQVAVDVGCFLIGANHRSKGQPNFQALQLGGRVICPVHPSHQFA